jgi:hypothetical protein
LLYEIHPRSTGLQKSPNGLKSKQLPVQKNEKMGSYHLISGPVIVRDRAVGIICSVFEWWCHLITGSQFVEISNVSGIWIFTVLYSCLRSLLNLKERNKSKIRLKINRVSLLTSPDKKITNPIVITNELSKTILMLLGTVGI